jgi:preprotein translocase subunit SecE
MFEKIKRFLKEVNSELKKVSWPTRKETMNSTMVVIVLMFFVAVFLGIVDVVLSRLIGLIL